MAGGEGETPTGDTGEGVESSGPKQFDRSTGTTQVTRHRSGLIAALWQQDGGSSSAGDTALQQAGSPAGKQQQRLAARSAGQHPQAASGIVAEVPEPRTTGTPTAPAA